jgi:hypothetical protein
MINRLNGCVYVDRMSRLSGKNAIEQAIDGVDRGYNMAIFPESTWNLFKDRLMLERKWGDVLIAQQTSRPIIPIGLVYNYNNCFVKFGDPFYVSKNDDLKEASINLGVIMEQLRADIINSDRYKILYKDISYEQWLIDTVKSYKHFDVGYEMSVIRHIDEANQDEYQKIIEIGEMVHPVSKIEKELESAKVNYRLR